MSDDADKSEGLAARRRRSWPEELKRQIVAESFAAGASVSVVARRHDINNNQLFAWRRRYGPGAAPSQMVSFVPVRLAGLAASAGPSGSAELSRIEITLVGGHRIMVGHDVDAAALKRVIDVLT